MLTQSEFERQSKIFDQIAELIEAANTIGICAHTSPDGDALGSNLALRELISSKWPSKKLHSFLADNVDIPRIYRFLPGSESFCKPADFDADLDLLICVDLPVASRLAQARPLIERSSHLAVIDHHPSPEPFGDVALVRPEAAACAVLITEMALHFHVDVTPSMATNLLCGLMTDTGRFQYQNADGEAFEVASLLVEAGANPSEISLEVYQSFRLQYLHLESAVMGRINTFCDGRISYSYVTLADLERTGALSEECDGLVDQVRSVEGSQIALLLKEMPDQTVRGNLRSKANFDISTVAAKLGGGGHSAAAGFSQKGSVDSVLAKVLPLLIELIEADETPSTSTSSGAVCDEAPFACGEDE